MSLQILKASVFSRFPEVRFGFSTRIGGVGSDPYGLNMTPTVGDLASNVVRNQNMFLESLGIQPDAVAVPGQVHGNSVVSVSKPGTYELCDALVTNTRDTFLRVTVADCLPLFVFDPSSHSIAAVHAGWRGCLSGIARGAITRMVDEFGAKPSSMRAYVGPAARSCCYEVGEEVAMQFENRFVTRRSGARPHLDMQAFTSSLLAELGLHPSHLEISSYCTICNPQLFHSYRREGEKSGRMTGVIGLGRIDS